MMFDRPDPLIEKLMGRLRDPDPIVRRNAAAALRLHGSRAMAAISELGMLLMDQDAHVRTEARRAVQQLRQEAA